MKLALTTFFLAAGPAVAAFAPSASFGVNTALKMSTEAEAATEKVRREKEEANKQTNKQTKNMIITIIFI